MNLRYVVGLSVLAGLLVSCEGGPRMTLVNGTGRPVVLRLAQGEPPTYRNVELGPEKKRTFSRLDVANERFVVFSVACEYTFAYPPVSGLNYPWIVPDGKGGSTTDYRYPFPLDMLLEPDFRLYLPAGGPVDGVSSPDPTPQHGFPMSPIQKTCS